MAAPPRPESVSGMSRPAISQQITFLYTRSLERTGDFYEGVLSLPLAVDQGSCRIYRVTDDAYLGFCERDDAPETPRGILYTLVTEDVDAWYAYLVTKGVPVDNEPAVNDAYGIYHFFARDPNGYAIEIQRFLDPTWRQLDRLLGL